MNYYRLGKLPLEVVNILKEEVIKKTNPNVLYQIIQFDEQMHNKFLEIFENTELKIQKTLSGKIIQKAFCSQPNNGFGIHKDGINCKSALNVVLSCNPTDWVRWYDDCTIDKISEIVTLHHPRKSRDVEIENYESIPYVDEMHNEVGDVYVLNVDKYHSFKCIGPNQRIILQTKFADFPDVETIYKSLKNKSFSCINTYV